MANSIPTAAIYPGPPTVSQIRFWRGKYFVDNNNTAGRGHGALFADTGNGWIQIRYSADGRAMNDPYPITDFPLASIPK